MEETIAVAFLVCIGVLSVVLLLILDARAGRARSSEPARARRTARIEAASELAAEERSPSTPG